MPRFLLKNTSQQHAGFCDLKGVIDRQILKPGETREVTAEAIESKSPYIDAIAMVKLRCDDCERDFYGVPLAKFEPAVCPRCARADRPNEDPTQPGNEEVFHFRHHGTSTPLLRR